MIFAVATFAFVASIPQRAVAQKSISEYAASNGITYRVGDTVKLGRGSEPNGDFRYLNIAGWAGAMSEDPHNSAHRNYSGFNAIVKRISYLNIKGAKRYYFIVGVGNITNFRLHIEDAIETCEVKPCKDDSRGSVIQQQSAADELLKFKKLRDDGIITEEEYQSKKEKLLK